MSKKVTDNSNSERCLTICINTWSIQSVRNNCIWPLWAWVATEKKSLSQPLPVHSRVSEIYCKLLKLENICFSGPSHDNDIPPLFHCTFQRRNTKKQGKGYIKKYILSSDKPCAYFVYIFQPHTNAGTLYKILEPKNGLWLLVTWLYIFDKAIYKYQQTMTNI